MLTVAILLFNFGILAVVVASSFSNTGFVVFPPHGFTIHWYSLAISSYHDSFLLSLRVALTAGLGATLVGTGAAMAFVRGRARHRVAWSYFLTLPIVVPTTLYAFALLAAIARVGWTPNFYLLVLAFIIVGTPFSVRIVAGALEGVDWSLEVAARTLGAGPVRAWTRVVLPVIWPSVASGFVFGFLVAFDDSVLSVFLARPGFQTFSAQVLSDIEQALTPQVAAACSLVIGVTLVGAIGLLLLYRLAQARRKSFSTGAAGASAATTLEGVRP